MGPTFLGVMLDSSVLIAAERRNLMPLQAIESVREIVGEISIVLVPWRWPRSGMVSTAPARHKIPTPGRVFLDEFKATVPIYSITEATAEIIAQIGGEQAAKGVNLPLADLIIGACALELGYAVGTGNGRDFNRIPGLHIIQL